MEKYEPKSETEILSSVLNELGVEKMKLLDKNEQKLVARLIILTHRQAESELLPLLQKSEERVRELEEERKDFHMMHRMKTDVETKKLYSRHEAMVAELKGVDFVGSSKLLIQQIIQSIITKFEKV